MEKAEWRRVGAIYWWGPRPCIQTRLLASIAPTCSTPLGEVPVDTRVFPR
jgi:hypothetical protein